MSKITKNLKESVLHVNLILLICIIYMYLFYRGSINQNSLTNVFKYSNVSSVNYHRHWTPITDPSICKLILYLSNSNVDQSCLSSGQNFQKQKKAWCQAHVISVMIVVSKRTNSVKGSTLLFNYIIVRIYIIGLKIALCGAQVV